MTPCKRCGARLLLSARMSGTGHCGPCRRATRFSLKRWLLKQWHRFTLGRAVYAVPPTVMARAEPGSYAAVGAQVNAAARAAVPAWIAVEVYHRRAEDVPRGTVRIVLETCE